MMFSVEFGVLGLGCCDDCRDVFSSEIFSERWYCRVLYRFGCSVAGLLRLEEALPLLFGSFDAEDFGCGSDFFEPCAGGSSCTLWLGAAVELVREIAVLRGLRGNPTHRKGAGRCRELVLGVAGVGYALMRCLRLLLGLV